MRQAFRTLAAAISASLITALLGLQFIAAQPAGASTAAGAGNAAPAALSAGSPTSPITGPPGFAMAEPIARSAPSIAGSPSSHAPPAAAPPAAPVNASYTHSPAPNPSQDLSPGNGPIMPATTIYFDFWLPAGQHYESTAAGDTNYENLLIRFARDISSTQYHNIVTQYAGTNGTAGNAVTFGGSWVDTTTPYPHAGTTASPLQDSDIQAEVHNAVTTNGWTEDINHIVAVFTATGIQECMGSMCTFSSNGFCAYHSHFSDGSNDAIYAFMSFDNFTHAAGKTCVAGQTSGDNDPNRGVYPNGDVSADAEVNTFSHELIEAETDPHPNATWTGPNGEIGDACNFNFAPRNDNGADVYLNGHPYIVQQEYSNSVHTCAIDLPTNGFCSGSVSKVCAPTTEYSKTVDVASPRVNSSVHYTLTLDNTSDTAAETNLTVADTVPAGYAVTGLSAPGSTSSGSTSNSITVSYDTLPVHQSRSIVVTASVPAQAGVTATNCGSLAGQDLLGTTLPGQTTVPCAVTSPVKIPTIVSYTGAVSGDFHDPATVSAILTDDSGNPLAGKTIEFTLNGAETCGGTTNASGTASCQITPGEPAGPYSLTAAFTDATDPVYAVSSTTATFTVTLEETTTTYTGPTVILQGGSGVTLSGRLLEDGTTPIAGRTLSLGLGSQTCTGTTDAAGNASCTLVFSGALGPQPLSAVFGGDAFYKPSSDSSQTAIVFAFPARGAFAIGDQTVAAATAATSVTWWGASWHKLNSLSSGQAPPSFKGFAAKVSLPASTPPTTCGSNWTTTPGNSPPPVDGVPSYLGVLVVSHVAKSGSAISGNTVHIVILKVAPGYKPNPGHPGTGTIVATYC